MKKNRAVFLDRDGTMNEEVGYLDSLDNLRLFAETSEAIKRINKSGLKAVVVTNQSGVARGYFTESFVEETHRRIQDLLKQADAHIDAFYYCPHHDKEGQEPYLKVCDCRKPKPGMLLKAAEDLDLDLAGSYMVGDTLKDMETAKNTGMKGVLVRTGHFSADQNSSDDWGTGQPDYVAADILAAVNWIMKDCGL
ncbi:MAG: D-glycero-beta-D-manno-heptose 1,7-bisphosphate 7-phosphatase [Deltaproteobacteria bacterium]|nr:D-glycero-beta-D-manno-heptose 1,7-bisphosphate 7-phosphatase [Deltaproteobacteria bacterium]